MVLLNKRKIILKIFFGYFLALCLMVGAVSFSYTRLNIIKETVDNLTNNLAETRSLAQGVTAKIRLVRFYAERYRRFYHQEDLDHFNDEIVDLKKGLNELISQTDNRKLLSMVQGIQREVHLYDIQFENITKQIMLKQMLLSTVFLKQELLIENQLSAIRINIGIVQEPDIFFSFGNARNAFQLMRLYQSKYLHEDDEKYYVMFKNNYRYACKAFLELKAALESVTDNSHIMVNVDKANEELKAYYEIFLKIRSASIDINGLSKKLDQHEHAVTQISSEIASRIEDEYKSQNIITHDLVHRAQVEMVGVVILAISLSLGLILVIFRTVTSPLFREMRREAEELKIAKNNAETALAQLSEAKQKVDFLAITDTLTGLNNRLKLDDELNNQFQRAQRYGNSFSVILLDLDKFKSVNDIFGHYVGDQVLKESSSILLGHTRKTDIVGRWGGEEFLVVCPETDMKGAFQLAENLRHAFEDRDFTDIGKQTCSFGVASYREGDEIQTMMERADKALYQAKEKGRNCVEAY
ncbi:GGDEF domain-containing protein [Maridesulfovibrio zosterae]|uniref:GGDEF domain-containing protein n=1 Tax=Maridesulfovibrio zosterae TaxID=82171 RepID=UPI000420200E|nr:GGDEF domain-containing protein [Maridesulfovibrio zosterae]